MAKHVITIEDLDDGGVWVNCDPPLQHIVDLCNNPDRMTSADGYAAAAHTAIQRESDGLYFKQLLARPRKTN